MKHLTILVSAAMAFACGTAFAQSMPVKKADGIFVNSEGMTVYTFDKDASGSGKSACNDGCATNWPAVPAGNAQPSAPYSTVTREDGSKQLAYKGKPLYLFAADKKPGDRKGDKVKDIWHVVKD